jgi:hypothetical protein
VRNITPMLNITRLWNGISAVSLMRRGVALALDYAQRRVAFGASIIEKPLHLDTLAGLQAETEAAFHLAFYVAKLVGLSETGEIGEEDNLLLRLLTPVMKLTTGKQAVAVTSETLEAFGGAGYVEDTGLPVLLRDSQVLPIWEGTTNVLSLDALRATGPDNRAFKTLKAKASRCLEVASETSLSRAANIAREALAHAESWLTLAQKEGQETLETGARRFAMTLGRVMELALLIEHAEWSKTHESDRRAEAAANRFANSGVDLITEGNAGEARSLLGF